MEKESASVAFVVPGVPVGKGRPRFAKRGNFVRTYTPDNTARYENLVKLAAQEAMKGLPPIGGAVALEVKVFLAVPASWPKKKQAEAVAGTVRPSGRPDADNLLKSVADGMNGVVFADDAQVTSCLVQKRYDTAPRVEVRAWCEAKGSK